MTAIKKGHWPLGKRRNNPRGWGLLVSRLKEVIRDRLSISSAAASIGVDSRTLRRWLAGEDVASEDNAAQIRAMLRRKE